MSAEPEKEGFHTKMDATEVSSEQGKSQRLCCGRFSSKWVRAWSAEVSDSHPCAVTSLLWLCPLLGVAISYSSKWCSFAAPHFWWTLMWSIVISTVKPMQVSYQRANGRWPGLSPGQCLDLYSKCFLAEEKPWNTTIPGRNSCGT